MKLKLMAAALLASTFAGAALAGGVDGPLRTGHWVMFAVISASTLGALVAAVRRRSQPVSVVGVVVVATCSSHWETRC